MAFPKNGDTISDNAFKNCTGIKGIEFSESISRIGAYAFYECNSAMAPMSKILQYWDDAKGQWLYKMFGEKFILSKDLSYSMGIDELSDRIEEQMFRGWDNTDCQEFIRAYRELTSWGGTYQHNYLMDSLLDTYVLAENIYKALGEELSLPTAAEIAEEFFTVETFIRDTTSYVRIPNYTPMLMYRHQTETDKYENVKNMFVDGYCGGRRYLVKEEDMWKVARSVIKEFKDGQLEAGDVIVSVKAKDTDNLNYEFDNIIVYVYDGSRLLVSRKTLDGVTYEIIPEENVYTELTKLYMTDKDLFFALRPSQIER